jgi:hypothetical protein
MSEAQKQDDVAKNWRVRFALPDGYMTFTDIGARDGSPMTGAAAWDWAQREVRESKGKYLRVHHIYSIDGELTP